MDIGIAYIYDLKVIVLDQHMSIIKFVDLYVDPSLQNFGSNLF